MSGWYIFSPEQGIGGGIFSPDQFSISFLSPSGYSFLSSACAVSAHPMGVLPDGSSKGSLESMTLTLF
jgi:hypothetical protein